MKTKPAKPYLRQHATRNTSARSALTVRRYDISGFTLVEILTVIAIIGILSAMLLVVVNRAQEHAREVKARLETQQILLAITEYEQTYSHFPVSSAVQQSGLANVTYGGAYNNASGQSWPPTPVPANYVAGNSDIMSILLDLTNFPGGGPTANANYQKNSRQEVYLSAKMTGDASSPGVGTDLNYRDPWGNPYIISIDLNADNKCEDLFYGVPAVSSSTGATGGSGLNGLAQQPDGYYAFHGNVMVWSMGPNGPFNHSQSSFNTNALATDPANKHHILSWQ